MIGTTISHFKILQKVSEGRLGEDYLPEDTELDFKVTLKFLPPYNTTYPEIKDRFKSEAKAAVVLKNPEVIIIHEVGEHEHQNYIAM